MYYGTLDLKNVRFHPCFTRNVLSHLFTRRHNIWKRKLTLFSQNPSNYPAESPLDLSRRLLISSSLCDRREPPSSSLTPLLGNGDRDHRLDVNAAVISPASTVASFSTDSGIRDDIQCHFPKYIRPYPRICKMQNEWLVMSA